MNRRNFLTTAALAGVVGSIIPRGIRGRTVQNDSQTPKGGTPTKVIVSTWEFGLRANAAANKTLEQGGSVLDAIEQGIHVPESDPTNTSVGYGGFPDRDGHVTLDACMMKGTGECGSVLCLEKIKHPISVARLVMEKTPHVFLAGEGALQFAREQGFVEENLLTPESEKAYREWLKNNNYKPMPVNEDHHDTIGMLAMSGSGNLAGGCSTSGLAWKMRGRVGDSPIIGAGLYVDNEVGAATATGLGEAVIKIAGSFLIVELMRNGKSPAEACRMAIERMMHRLPQYASDGGFQIGFIALSSAGEAGGYSYRKGFQYALTVDGESSLVNSEHLVE